MVGFFTADSSSLNYGVKSLVFYQHSLIHTMSFQSIIYTAQLLSQCRSPIWLLYIYTQINSFPGFLSGSSQSMVKYLQSNSFTNFIRPWKRMPLLQFPMGYMCEENVGNYFTILYSIALFNALTWIKWELSKVSSSLKTFIILSSTSLEAYTRPAKWRLRLNVAFETISLEDT